MVESEINMAEGEVATSSSLEDAPTATNLDTGESLVANNHEGSLPDDENWLTDDEEADKFFLYKEGERRREEFYNAGYRDGVTAGQNDAAQDGFNEGFKDSVMVGYKWGIVRGVTSALAHIPNELKLRLVESEEKRKEYLNLYEAVDSIGREDALKLFYDDIQRGTSARSSKAFVSESSITNHGGSELNDLESYFEKLDLLLKESPHVDVQLELSKNSAP